MKKHIITRFLHALLGLAVIHQLIISNFMQAPLDGKKENFAFELHETFGLISLGIVVLFWAWTLLRKVDTSFSSLVPWFSSDKRSIVMSDAKAFFSSVLKRDFAKIPIDSALASAVHGLGLLSVLAAASTGAGWFIFEESNKDLAEWFIEAHVLVTTLVWAYLIGHASIAIVHELAGHSTFRRVFPFGR